MLRIRIDYPLTFQLLFPPSPPPPLFTHLFFFLFFSANSLVSGVLACIVCYFARVLTAVGIVCMA